MNLQQLKTFFYSELTEVYPQTEIDSFFNLLTEFHLGMTRIDRALQPDLQINSATKDYFENAITQLKREYPIQYLIGATEFYGFSFEVNEHVLIPRPETEELVEWILDDFQDRKNLSILDIGTGTGCIAISLAKKSSGASATAMDISEKALATAKRNAQKNKAEITFLQQDILTTEMLDGKFDIIVSNPPYVRELEKEEMSKNVLDFEPDNALFVSDKKPLVFYEKIAELAFNSLNPNGKLYFEINQYLGKETLEMLNKKGFENNHLKQDIFGKDRMTKSFL